MSNGQPEFSEGDEFDLLEAHSEYGEVETYVVDECEWMGEADEYGYILQAKDNSDRRIGFVRESEIEWMLYDDQLDEA